MDPDAMKPFGLAILDYYRGGHSATIVTERDDGFQSDLPAQVFFRQARDFELEGKAMDLCRGRVLDVGGGSGCHSLYLQDKGFQVTAIDVSPEAVLIMRERGVKDVRQVDIFDLRKEQFDTVIMMGHGIGVVETIAGLRQFLARVRRLIKPGGAVLLTSLDVSQSPDARNIEYQKNNIARGHYAGEIGMRFIYRDVTGPWFTWLHIDPETLKAEASKSSWNCEIVRRQDDGNHLARLTLAA